MSHAVVVWEIENYRVLRLGQQIFAEVSSSQDRMGTRIWCDAPPLDILKILKRAVMVLHMQFGGGGVVHEHEGMRVVRDGDRIYAECTTERDRTGSPVWTDAPMFNASRILKAALLVLDARIRTERG